MRGDKVTRIFISYARKDGAKLAQRLYRDLAAHGLEPWRDQNRIHGGAIWTKEIQAALDEADVVLALLTTGSYETELCRAEQVHALDKGICVIPLLVQKDTEVPWYLKARQYLDFTGTLPYPDQFATLVADIIARSGIVLDPGCRATHNNAPPLPDNFVDRPAELEALRNVFFADGGSRNIGLTALDGMGGIGKTVLAQALCDDDVVRQAFPDGIFWFTIGKESRDFVTRMREVPALNHALGTYEGERGCINQYRDVFRGKAALIVLDDVWHAHDIEPFRAKSARSRLLFTTRDASIASVFGARGHTVDVLTEEQSRLCLGRWSGRCEGDLPEEAGDLIRECGRLPLALSMIGARMRGKPIAFWKGVLNDLRKADLKKIQADFPEPHTSLFRAIQVSVDALDSEARERYLALAVLLEDMAAAPAILRTLWNTNEFETLEISEYFVSRSLAQRDGDSGAIRLHDLQLDYIRALSPLREALPLIHGAVRLSAHVIARDPVQFASQMTGRLLPHEKLLPIERFLDSIAQGAARPWLRPLHPALASPGGALVRTLEGHSKSVHGVALSADGRRAVSASDDNTLKVWDLQSGRALRTLHGHSGPVNCVALSPDGRRAVSSSWDHTLKVWDLESGRALRTLHGHSGPVNCVALSPDGRRAVSASGDGTLKVWDLQSGRALGTLHGHSYSVNGVALSPDGRQAVSASEGNTLKVWDLQSGRELRTLQGHSYSVNGVALSPDGRQAVSASEDGTLKVWDLQSGRALGTLDGHSGPVNGVALSPDGRRAVSASWDNTLKVWDLESGCELRTLQGHSLPVRGVELSANGRLAVSASDDKTLKLWDLESGRELRTPQGHSLPINGVALSPDGRRAVSASADNTLKVWDLETGRALRTLEGHADSVNGVALSPNRRLAVSASDSSALKVWDLKADRVLRILRGHSDSVNDVALGADGRRAVSASSDNTLKIWDLETGRVLRNLEGHSGSVNGVALCPDAQRAVSASSDHTLRVWDLEAGKAAATFTCEGIALCCVFGRAGTIVGGDSAGRMYFLSLELPDES